MSYDGIATHLELRELAKILNRYCDIHGLEVGPQRDAAASKIMLLYGQGMSPGAISIKLDELDKESQRKRA